jgi:adenosylhomocysteine nucleosidase
MRLLIVASDRMEFAGLIARAAKVEVSAAAVDWSRRIRFGDHEALVAANGVGAARAAAAVDAALAVFVPEAVISAGFCGALDPAFGIADVVVATEIRCEGERHPALPISAAGAFRSGPVASVPYISRTSAQKAELRASGACAVEMEAAGVLRRARGRGLPFYCARAVTDLAGETLVNDFGACLRSDGHFDTMALLSNALRSPLRRLPELIRLRRRSIRASRALGEFLANCRF